jgi:hypothetical protein
MYASKYGHSEVVEILIENNANIDIEDYVFFIF